MADSAEIISVVALFISVTSFIVAVAQVLNQYISSADGYRRCSTSVMGGWASATKRNFRWNELRFDTVFETPVFFLSRPDNKRGPIAGRDIHNVDGTIESFSSTQMSSDLRQDSFVVRGSHLGSYHSSRHGSHAQSVHTVVDELASWVTLLSRLQELERSSRLWDKERSMPPKMKQYEPALFTYCVQVQSKTHNWDFMPDSVQKPFATSTISHLAQLAAFLGMIWRAFDLDSGILRAEGNGLVLTSSQIPGLGVAVSFVLAGGLNCSSRRTIPCQEIRLLVFGTVPTIIHNLHLKFGDDQDLRRTLKSLKLRHSHIVKYMEQQDRARSVNFELIAMIGEVFRQRGSNFKVIPNPTPDRWVKNFSACALMKDFYRNLTSSLKDDESNPPSPQIESLQQACQAIVEDSAWRDLDKDISIDMREAVHSVLDTCTTFLQSCNADAVVSVVGAHISALRHLMDQVDTFLNIDDRDNDNEIFEHYFNQIAPLVVRGSGSGASSASVRASPALSSSAISAMSTLAGDVMQQRQDIWVTLQCRMCCWWLLHDLEENDAMILPPRLIGSRMPIYIL